MKKQKQFLLLLGLFFISKISYSQGAINVTSNTIKINGIIHDYSIGEMTMITTEMNANLIVTQGILQPGNFTKKTNDEILKSDLIDFVKVYPNPTENLLFVELLNAENATIQLFDAVGKMILETKSTTQKSTIDLSPYSTGNYYLVVFSPNNQTQKMSFKIQKIK
jgi:hypothetical protein